MTIHRVKLKDLNKEYLRKLQEQVVDEEQEIAIWFPKKSNALSDVEFWKIISLLDWKKTKYEHITAPVVNKLSELSTDKIKCFDDILSEKLFTLDQQEIAENTGKNAYKGEEQSFSVDGFLYARCMIVAQGKKYFEKIMVDPSAMIKNKTFEPILSLASRAYSKKTNQPYEHIPAYIYETFANTKGWNNRDFLANLLG